MIERYNEIYNYNKKENFIKELITRTRQGKIVWRQSSKYKYEENIYDSDKIIRLFEASVKNNTFVIIEKKLLIFSIDSGDHEEAFVELNIIDSQIGLKTCIDENNVSREYLFSLLSVISDQANDLEDILFD